MEWLSADAKNRFSELINLALAEGPQLVRRRKDEVMVIDRREYERLTGKNKKPDLIEFLLNSQVDLSELDLTRDKSTMRDIEFESST